VLLEKIQHGESPKKSHCVEKSKLALASLAGDRSLHLPFERLTVAEAFARYAGFDLFAAAETEAGMEAEARRLGLDPIQGIGIVGLYDLIFIHAVEPMLKMKRPIALLDYPAFVPCLAQQNADGKTVQRWELYYNGIELANCFSEETDAQRVRDFFESESRAKEQNALVKHTVDKDYWKIYKKNLHSFSGVALGLDRLIMGLCGPSSIDSVLPFPMK
jgi:lysyl-tRNA synthetase class 2